MSEELTEPMEDQVEEVVEETTVDTEETQDPAEDRQSFLDKLREMGRKFVESNKSGEEEVKEAEEVKEVRDADSIPPEFTEAARKAGWGDDQIAEFAGDYDDDELKALVSALFMDDESGEESEEPEGKEEEKEAPLDDVEVDPKIQAYLKKQMEELQAQHKRELDDLKKGLGEVEQERQVKEIQRIQKTTDTFFDKLGEEFPVFGKTEELTVFPKGTPQEGQIVPVGEAYKARNDVFQTAWKFKQMGSDWQEALNDAWYLYRGKNMEKELHTKLVKDLKRNEKRLSPKRTPQNTQKTYDNPVDEKRDFIREAARKAGMTI